MTLRALALMAALAALLFAGAHATAADSPPSVPAAPGSSAARTPPGPDLDRQWRGYFPSRKALESRQMQRKLVMAEARGGLPKELQVAFPLPDRHWRQVRGDDVEGGRILAAYVSPRGLGGGFMDVAAYDPPVEVNQGDWLQVVIESHGFKLLASRRAQAAAGDVYEVLASLDIPDKATNLVRAAVFRSGSTFFLVRCLAPAPAFKALAWDFAAAVYLFKPLNPQPPRRVGKWDTACLPPHGPCYEIPQGLQVIKPEVKGGGPMAAYRIKRGKKTVGSLRLELLPPPPAGRRLAPSQALAFLKGRLEEAGGRYTGCAVVPSRHKALQAPASFLSCRPAQPGGMSLLAMAISSSPRPLVVWMTLPPRMADPWGWMQAKAIYEVVGRTLAPPRR